MGRAVKRNWWRRNAVALAAVAVLLPATLGAVFATEWWRMFQAQPVFATVIPAGAQGEWADADWGPASITDETAQYAADLPPGTRVLVAEIPVRPGEDEILCSPPTLRELDGVGRQWDEATTRIDWDYDRPTLCASDAVGSYTVAVPFVVPDDVQGPLGVDVEVLDELPRFLRLVVVP